MQSLQEHNYLPAVSFNGILLYALGAKLLQVRAKIKMKNCKIKGIYH